ncbi:Malate/lactate/ureidoglycolate dehydrogenase, LDH2 family [Singulisphaera sp. GP187]|uniref:Ldh family oxidoreductase n=1 Tax=Singulisphaera sp. GP187 TaxID=1882752 RepID=UPI00092681DB|nr:Ldh family oxidoreductase [Singulisphaera sp. GP187]SIO65691.1 Malate/lactate/ureidoglycolate dehydrogenase, LDH2 family [Singulisphaera sp. GP187]
MTDVVRYRLDDLRRFASGLGVGVGMPSTRASAFAAQLLWYNTTGASSFGIETLPDWLERMARGEVDPRAEGKVTSEHQGTAVFDGENGLPALILARAGELATEKARDAAIGLVRVANIKATGPAAGIAGEIAFGPFLAAVLGPGPTWSLALPSGDGLPAVFDSTLEFEAVATASNPSSATRPAKASPLALWAPWATAMVPHDGWLIVALGIQAIESLSGFHERVSSTMRMTDEAPGRLLPTTWETRRREARERGIPVTKAVVNRFSEWAGRCGVPLPSPVAQVPPSDRSPRGVM